MTKGRTGFSRRDFGLMAGATLATPYFFTRRAGAEIRRGDRLVVGIWGGAQERITREFIATPLEQEYGVTIDFILGGTGDRRARAYAERGRPSFDVIYLNIFESRQAVADGVTQAPTESVSNYANLYPIARQGGFGVAFNPVDIVYDRTKITTPITSWLDLWREDVYSQLSWPTGLGAQGASALLMAAVAHGGSEFDIDVGFDKIAEIAPFPAVHGSQDQLYTLFDQGVVGAGIEFGSFTRAYAEARNPNIEIVTPVEGSPLTMNVACITEGTENQALAEAWVNLHLSPECQRAYAEQIYYGPTITNLELEPELAAKVVYGEDDVDQLLQFDWEHIAANFAPWTDRLNRIVRAG